MDQPNTTNALAEKVLARIEEERITPIPVWRFSAKNTLFWSSAIICIAVGAIAIASAIFVFANAGWRYYSATHNSFFTFFVQSLPYLWLIVTVLFLLLTYENIRHTKHGYRPNLISILMLSLTISAAGGTILYFTGIGQIFDHYIAINLPFHDSVIEYQQKLWENEQRGLVAGSVDRVSEDADWFTLTSFSGNEWKIYTNELTREDFENIASFPEVRIVGAPGEQSHEMTGCLVFPWTVHGEANYLAVNTDPENEFLQINCLTTDCERNIDEARITKCKEVQPYESLKLIRK